MKNLILLLTLIVTTSFSLQSQVNISNTEDEGTEAPLHKLSIDHPNKNQMETFLNTYKEEFILEEEIKVVLEHENLIQKRYDFYTKESGIHLTLIFCKNQEDALKIAETNFYSTKDHQEYGVNGAVLFVVNGKDDGKINTVLSWFSGEE